MLPENEDYAKADEWVTTHDRASLLRELQAWRPVFHKLVAPIEHAELYKICTRQPLRTLRKGRQCVLGDALHPMPLYRAQGGNQSIEDAGVVEMCFSNLSSLGKMVLRLGILDKLRIARVVAVQLVSTIRQDETDVAQRRTCTLKKCRACFQGQDQADCEHSDIAGTDFR